MDHSKNCRIPTRYNNKAPLAFTALVAAENLTEDASNRIRLHSQGFPQDECLALCHLVTKTGSLSAQIENYRTGIGTASDLVSKAMTVSAAALHLLARLIEIQDDTNREESSIIETGS